MARSCVGAGLVSIVVLLPTLGAAMPYDLENAPAIPMSDSEDDREELRAGRDSVDSGLEYRVEARLGRSDREVLDRGGALVVGNAISDESHSFLVTSSATAGVRAEHLLFFFLGVSLVGIAWLYRREDDSDLRLRLAGAAGLIAVLFMSTAPGMTWTRSNEIGATADRLECMLGEERDCVQHSAAGWVPGSEWDDATALEDRGFDATLDRARWLTASVRAGHLSMLFLLLPAFVWLMVAPRSVWARALVIAGAAPAVFTGVSAAAHGWVLARWQASAVGAAELVTLGCASLILIAACAAVEGRRSRVRGSIPTAIALAGRQSPQVTGRSPE